jgi:hypothetical protein
MGDKLMATKNMCDAILAVNPSAIFRISGEWVHENIVWQDDTTPISKADIAAKLVEIQAEEDVLDKILELEAAVTPRRVRDSILTDAGKTWLDDQEKLIAVERAKL